MRTGLVTTICFAALFYIGCKSNSKQVDLSTVTVQPVEQLPEFSVTPSGLKYRILKDSKRRKPRSTDKVTVHYKGWLDNNTVFDSSYKKGPISFKRDGVVKGWTEGMQLVGEGGSIELEIPPELGYGAVGAPGSIPPNATLHFQIELIDIE